MREFVIGVNDAGQRIDKFLLKACPKLPKSLLYKTFRKKDVKCNGKRVSAELFVAAGDTVQVYLPDDCFGETVHHAPQAALPLPEIAYEDADIVILRKPVNLPVHADNEGASDTLAGRFVYYLAQSGSYDAAAEQSFTPALCNRLDRNTEGFVIGAKNAAALRCMNEKIRLGEVRKQYLCVTVGQPPRACATVTAYHAETSGNRVRLYDAAGEGRREIRTGYEVLAVREGLALVLVTLYTGRKHQIRAQMAALGAPVLGDGKYGDAAANRQYGERHQLLAACRLRFDFSEADCPLAYLRGKTFAYTPDFCARYAFECSV